MNDMDDRIPELERKLEAAIKGLEASKVVITAYSGYYVAAVLRAGSDGKGWFKPEVYEAGDQWNAALKEFGLDE